eukprot:scaffold11.g3929.t1
MEQAAEGQAGPGQQRACRAVEGGVDRVATALIGVACALYLLRCLPALLFPAGMESLLALLLGFALGVAAMVGAVVVAYYHLMLPGRLKDAFSHALHPGKADRLAHGGAGWPHRGAGACAEPGSPRATLPHAVATGGVFSGLVYTVPASEWPASAVTVDWPPTSDASKPFKTYHAAVSQGTLVLTPAPAPPPARLRSSATRSRAAAACGAEAARAADAAGSPGGEGVEGGGRPGPPQQHKIGIPLEGCTVEVVTEGLAGRSDLVRRAPLVISHPNWNLLDGERSFYLFADEPASKQQWLHALRWWCEGGERVRAIEALYLAYCTAMRERTCLEYAHQVEGEEGALPDAHDAGSGADGQQPHSRRGWKRWGKGIRRRLAERRHAWEPGGAEEGGLPMLPAPTVHSVPELSGAAAWGESAGPAAGGGGAQQQQKQQLESLDKILEARWMQSTKIPVPKEPRSSHARRAASSASLGGAVAAHPADAAEGNSGSGFITPVLGTSPADASLLADGARALPRVGTSPARFATTAAASSARSTPARPLSAPRLPPSEAVPVAASSAPAAPSAAASTALPADQQAPASPSHAAAEEAHGAAPAGVAAASGVPTDLPPGLPPLLSADQAINAFVTRVCFDALRLPSFQEHIRSRIQRQLDRLHTPDYVHELTCVAVDLGCTAPTLRNFAALPALGEAVFPQLLFDMRYEGDFSLLLETKVDIRDAAAWGRLDKALTRMEGRQPAAAAGAGGIKGGGDAAPPGDASPGETDEESEGGEPSSGGSSATGLSKAGAASPSPSRPAFMKGLRKTAAKKLRQLAETTASHIKRTPLRLRLTFSLLEGTMAVFVPPPPGNRLFYSFVLPPSVSVVARPEVNHRLLKSGPHVSRVSAWIEQRVRASIQRNTVYPGCGDVIVPLMMDLHHGNAADGLPGLAPYLQQLVAAAPGGGRDCAPAAAASSGELGGAAAEAPAGAAASPEPRALGSLPSDASSPAESRGLPSPPQSLSPPQALSPPPRPPPAQHAGTQAQHAGSRAPESTDALPSSRVPLEPAEQQRRRQQVGGLGEQQGSEPPAAEQPAQDAQEEQPMTRCSSGMVTRAAANAPEAGPSCAAGDPLGATGPAPPGSSVSDDGSAAGRHFLASSPLSYDRTESFASARSESASLRRTTSGVADGSAAEAFARQLDRQLNQQRGASAGGSGQRRGSSGQVGAQISSSLARLRQQASASRETLRNKSGNLLARLTQARTDAN